jgi:hypothetical protein
MPDGSKEENWRELRDIFIAQDRESEKYWPIIGRLKKELNKFIGSQEGVIKLNDYLRNSILRISKVISLLENLGFTLVEEERRLEKLTSDFKAFSKEFQDALIRIKAGGDITPHDLELFAHLWKCLIAIEELRRELRQLLPVKTFLTPVELNLILSPERAVSGKTIKAKVVLKNTSVHIRKLKILVVWRHPMGIASRYEEGELTLEPLGVGVEEFKHMPEKRGIREVSVTVFENNEQVGFIRKEFEVV